MVLRFKKNEYIFEINEMNPNQEFKEISLITIDYLHDFLENCCGAYDMGHKLDFEEYVYTDVLMYSK